MAKHVGKQERRKQLVDAALAAFAEKGYHATQVSDIIGRAQVARGTFYLYFDSKHALFGEIIKIISQRIVGEIKPIGITDIPHIPEQIKGNIERTAQVLLADPGFVKIIFNDAVGVDKEFDARLGQFYADILGQIKKALTHGQRLMLVRKGDVGVMSVFLLGAIKELFYQNALGNQDLDAAGIRDEVFSFVLHAVLRPKLVSTMVK